MVMLVTVTPGAPKAKAPCGGAPGVSVMLSVYDVPFPEAAHLSPVGDRTTALDVATRLAADTTRQTTTPP